MTCQRPFFSYYGSKFRLRSTYPVPIHETVVEPFAGSAGYSTQHASKRVILCDLNPKVAAVWRYLIGVSARELLALPDVGDTEDVRTLGIPQEAQWLIGWWLDKAERTPRFTPSNWMKERRQSAQFWGPRLRLALSRQVALIRHWRVFECDYREAPVAGPATWFVDPPYQGKPGERYRFGSHKLDFAELGDWCRSRRGQVIVCEQIGADWLPFRTHAETHGLTRRSREVIWTVPAPNQLALFGGAQ